MKLMIETKSLTKKYNGERALDDVSIKVPQNKIYGLLGPNGAGKSTLLKILTGIINPSEGEVFFKEERWNRGHLKHMGSIVENAVIYPNLTARENLKVRTIQLGLEESSIDYVLDKVNLKDTGKKVAKKFSMGMKQRLGIALALINNPKLLILDEPTNGLDPYGIAELRELVKELSREGITVIISSHILAEIHQIADYIGIINKGKLCYEGQINKENNLEELFMRITSNVRSGGIKSA